MAWSPTKRSRRPMATGSSVSPTMQTPSHCVLLRADAAADRRQQIACGDDVVGAADILGGDRFDEFRDIDIDRATGDAGRLGAHQTALGFVLRLLQRIAAIHLFEILHPHLRVQLAHRSALLRDASNRLFLLGHAVNPVRLARLSPERFLKRIGQRRRRICRLARPATPWASSS